MSEDGTLNFRELEDRLRAAIANRSGCAFLVDFVLKEGLCINTDTFAPTYVQIQAVAGEMADRFAALFQGNDSLTRVCDRIENDLRLDGSGDPSEMSARNLCLKVHRRLVQELFIDPVGVLQSDVAEILGRYDQWSDGPRTNPFFSPENVNSDRLEFLLRSVDHYAVRLDGSKLYGDPDMAWTSTGVNDHGQFGLMNENDRIMRFQLMLILDELAKFHISRRVMMGHVPFVQTKQRAVDWLYTKLLQETGLFENVVKLDRGHLRDIVVTIEGKRFGIVVAGSQPEVGRPALFSSYDIPDAANGFVVVFVKMDPEGGYKGVWLRTMWPAGETDTNELVENNLNLVRARGTGRTGARSVVSHTESMDLATKIYDHFNEVKETLVDEGIDKLRSYILPPNERSPEDERNEWNAFAETFWSDAQTKRMRNVDAGTVWDKRCSQLLPETMTPMDLPNTWIGSWRVREELAQAILYALVTGNPKGKWCSLFDQTKQDLMDMHMKVLADPCVSEWLAARSSTVRRALEMPADVFFVDMQDRLMWSNMEDTPLDFLEQHERRFQLVKDSREKLIKFVAGWKNDRDRRSPNTVNSIVAGSLNAGALSFAIDNLVLVWEFVIANKMVSPRFPLGKVFDGSSSDMQSVVGSIVALLEIGPSFDTEIIGVDDATATTTTTITNINSHPTVKIEITAVGEKVLETPANMTRIRVVCTQWNQTQRAKQQNHTRELETLREKANKLTETREEPFADFSQSSSAAAASGRDRNFLARGAAKWRRGDATTRERKDMALEYEAKQLANTFRKKMLFTVVSIDPPFFAQGGSDSLRRFLPRVFFGSRLVNKHCIGVTKKEFVLSNYANYYNRLTESRKKINHLEAIGGMTAGFADSPDWFSRYEHPIAPLEHKKEWVAEFDGLWNEQLSFVVPGGAPVPQIRCGLGGSITKASEVWAFLCGVLDTNVALQFEDVRNDPIRDRQTITKAEWMRATQLISQAVSERNSTVVFGAQSNTQLCDPALVPPVVALGWDGPMMRGYSGVFVTLFGAPLVGEYDAAFWARLHESIKARRGPDGEITLRSIGRYLDRHRKAVTNSPSLTMNAVIKTTLQTERDNFFDLFEKKWKLTNSQIRSHVIRTLLNTHFVSAQREGNRTTLVSTVQPEPLRTPPIKAPDDKHLKRWLLNNKTKSRTHQRQMQWLRVRNSIFEAAALDDDRDDDNMNGPFPLQSVMVQTYTGAPHFLRGACRFYYAMVQCRTTMEHAWHSLQNVDVERTGRRNESRFLQIERCVNRAHVVFDCINDGTYRQGPTSKQRSMFRHKTELLGTGDLASNGYPRTTNGSSTDLLQTPLDEDEGRFTCNVVRVVAAMKSPAEFAAHYPSKTAFQTEVKNVITWFFDWIVAKGDTTQYVVPADHVGKDYYTNPRCNLNDENVDTRSGRTVNPDTAPSWAQLVRTCRTVAKLVGADTTMFDILNEYDGESIAYMMGVEEEADLKPLDLTNLAKSLSEGLFLATRGDDSIERFTKQAEERFAPVFEDFVVNGVMHSLETAADRGLDFRDLPTDITRTGAREWLRSQYNSTQIPRYDEDRFRNLFDDAGVVPDSSDLLPIFRAEEWSEQSAKYIAVDVQIMRGNVKPEDREEKLNEAKREFEAQQEIDRSNRRTARVKYNRAQLKAIVTHIVERLNRDTTAGADAYWTAPRDAVWLRDWPQMLRFLNGNWVDEIENIERALLALDIPGFDADENGRAQARARDRVLKNKILEIYKPVAVDEDDETIDERGEQRRQLAADLENELASRRVDVTIDTVEEGGDGGLESDAPPTPPSAGMMATSAAPLTKGAIVWSETRKETGRVVTMGQLMGNATRAVYDDVVVEFTGNRVVSMLPESVVVLSAA